MTDFSSLQCLNTTAKCVALSIVSRQNCQSTCLKQYNDAVELLSPHHGKITETICQLGVYNPATSVNESSCLCCGQQTYLCCNTSFRYETAYERIQCARMDGVGTGKGAIAVIVISVLMLVLTIIVIIRAWMQKTMCFREDLINVTMHPRYSPVKIDHSDIGEEELTPYDDIKRTARYGKRELVEHGYAAGDRSAVASNSGKSTTLWSFFGNRGAKKVWLNSDKTDPLNNLDTTPDYDAL